MWRSICSFIIIVCLCTRLSAQEKTYQIGVVGFYNCENFYDTLDDPKIHDEEFTPTGDKHYNGEVYKDKVHRLAMVLSQIATDVTPDGLSMIGVSEIENLSVMQDLVSQPEFAKRNYKIVHYDSPDERGVDVGFIYNPKYFTYKYSVPLNVPLKFDSIPHPTRDILWVNGLYLGEEVNVFVNHWPSRRGGEDASAPARALAAGVAKHVIDSLMKINPNTKVILMGDLNDDPISPSVAKILGATGDKSKVAPGELFNPWVKMFKNGIGTLAYNDAWNLFDQIMISSAWLDTKQKGFFFSKAVIFHKDFMIQQTGQYKGYPLRTFNGNNYQYGYSDHFPTYLVFMREVTK